MSIDRKINRIQFLTGNSLKFIAVLTMINVQKRIAEKKAAAQSEFYKEQLQ